MSHKTSDKSVHDYFKLLIGSTKWIIIGTFMCGVVAAAISVFFMSNVFQSEAQLVVIPPPFKTELSPPPLSVKTCKVLLGSLEIVSSVKNSILTQKSFVDKLYSHLDKKKPGSSSDQVLKNISELDSTEIAQLLNLSLDDRENADIISALSNLSVEDARMFATLEVDKFTELKIEDLKRNLRASVSVETKTNVSVEYSPLISLTAEAPSPHLAKAMANTWAARFMKLYTDLYQSETAISFDFLENQYNATRGNLLEAEANITSFTKSVKLDVIEDEIEVVQTDLKSLNSRLQNLMFEYTLKEAELDETDRQLNAVEENGRWIGFYSEDASRQKTATPPGSVVDSKPDSTRSEEDLQTEILEKLRKDSFAISELLANSQKEMEEYTKAHNYATQNEKKTKLIDLISSNRQLLSEIDVSIDGLRKALGETQAMLKVELPYISLDKSITDDALWELIMSDPNAQKLDALKKVKFTSQEINIPYETLKITLMELTNELAQKSETRKGVKIKIAELEIDLAQTDEKIAEYKTKTDLLTYTDRAVKSLGNKISDLYSTKKKGLTNLRMQVAVLKSQKDRTRQAIEGTRQRLSVLIDHHREKSVEHDELLREKMRVEYTYELLEEKYEQAKIAKAEQVPDIKIATRAIAAEKKIGPHRKVIVLAAMCIGFAIACLLSIFRAILREYENG